MRLLNVLAISLLVILTEQQQESCRGACTSYMSSRKCQCDESCSNGYLQDCCQDYRRYCADRTPPIVICPPCIVQILPQNQHSVPVTWEKPLAHDNRADPVFLSVSHPPGSWFSLGTTLITYHAMDFSKNRASCSFNITIQEQSTGDEDDAVGISVGMITMENAMNVMNQLEQFTEGEPLDSEGLVLVANIIEKVSVFETASMKLTGSIVKVVDNVIHSGTGTMPSPEASSTIVKSLDRVISTTQSIQDNFVMAQPHLSVTATSYDGIAVQKGIGFVLSRFNETGHESLGKTNAKISSHTPSNDIDVACSLPREIGRYVGIEGASQHLDVSYTVFSDDSLFVSSMTSKDSSLKVLSRVLGINIPNVIVRDLRDPVKLSFHGDKNTINSNPRCVFWDFALQNGRGDWSTEGCTTSQENDMITCTCNHLTHFSVLIDFRGTDVSGNMLLTLELISRLGCLISIGCLFATLIAFTTIPRLRSQEPQRILINLCISLMCLYIVFVIGIDKADSFPEYVCMAVAILLHYFTLTTILWTAVEAIHLYLNLVKVFKSDINKFLLKAGTFAWGSPLIIVIFMIGWQDTRGSYRNPYYCYMEPGLEFFVSIIVPVAIVLTFNLSVFIRVMFVLFRSSKLAKKPQGSRFKRLSQRAQNVIGISVLLGLSWLFGFMTFDSKHDYIFDILFCIMNSLHGFFIFIFFCLKQKEVRTIWVSQLSNYSLSRPSGSSFVEQPFKQIEIRTTKKKFGLTRWTQNIRK